MVRVLHSEVGRGIIKGDMTVLANPDAGDVGRMPLEKLTESAALPWTS